MSGKMTLGWDFCLGRVCFWGWRGAVGRGRGMKEEKEGPF